MSEPTRRWGRRKTVAAIAVGAAGLLLFDHATVPFSQPKFCVSCHEMEKPYASWQQSPHFVNRSGVQVTCSECHLPHRDDRIAHLASRFWAGAKDLSVSLLGGYNPGKSRQRVLQTLPNERCRKCHANLASHATSIASVKIVHIAALKYAPKPARACVACHDSLHGPRAVPPPAKKYQPTNNQYCLDCHINFRQEEFTVAHGKAGVGCVKCHGATDDHASDEEHLTAPDVIYSKAKVNNSCAASECHPQPAMKKEIGHRLFFAGTDPEHRYCTDCHGQHMLPKRTRRWDKETRQLIEARGQPLLPARSKPAKAGTMQEKNK